MSITWVKVRCFLDMMGSQELYSSLLLTCTTSSSSLSCSFPLHPSSFGAERWQVGEKTIKQILSVIQPTSDSEKRRREIIKYLQTLIEDSFGIKVFPFGSVPLKTYLPHGDVDLTAVSQYDKSQDLAADIHSLLRSEMMNNTKVQVKDVLYVPAQVKVVKCNVSDIAVDISFNQTAGLSALCFLEQVDQFIGKDHLFKRSVTLIKAWCYYESRLLGGYYGLISTYALETMVLHVINHFHCSLHFPLAVLYKFLEYYSMFDWGRYCVAINGLVSISSLPEIKVHPPLDSDEILVTEDFLRGFRETFLSSAGASFETKKSAFPVKFLNIMDPLRDDNNLGRCVSKGNFFRIKNALNYGSEKMTEVLMLPPEKIAKALENFFINTLERNGRGSRADVLIPVPEYGAGGSETPSAKEDSDDLLTGIEYDLWFDDYGIVSPIQLNTPGNPQVWGNQWVEMSHRMQFDQSIYYDRDESPLSSDNTPRSLQLTNAACEEDKGKSRGTGAYLPHLDHLLELPQKQDHRLKGNIGLEGSGKKEEEESGKDSKTEDSQAIITPNEEESSYVGGNRCVVSYTLEDFPLLPGGKPMPTPINFYQPESPKSEEVDDTFSVQAVENGSFNCLSPRSVTVSEPGKQLDADVSAVQDSPNDLALAAGDKKETSKIKEKPVVVVKPLELKDEKEFPSLRSVRPPPPRIRFNKKEFPPLGKNVKLEKQILWKKNLKEVFESGNSKELKQSLA